MNKTPIIAIDGTAASGKGTLARRLAQSLGYSYLDSGKLYRYVGYSMVQQGQNPENETQAIAMASQLKDTLNPENLQNTILSSDEAGKAASQVGPHQKVREILLDYQRDFATNPPDNAKGAVLDGRDIGTIVCPDADLKLYIDANVEIRAKRRHKELQSNGISVTYDAVLADMQERDQRDASRKAAPMKPADDAIMLDTSDMGIDEVLETVLSLVSEALADS